MRKQKEAEEKNSLSNRLAPEFGHANATESSDSARAQKTTLCPHRRLNNSNLFTFDGSDF